MNNQLAKEFTVGSLLKFSFPTMVMMVFMSLYTIIDGIFVSRFLGAEALSAVNIVYPLTSIIMAFGIMLATGGSAIIARKMGEKNEQVARQDFTLIVVVGVLSGILLLALFQTFLEPLLRLCGATDELLPWCVDYFGVLLWFAPLLVLQLLFQTFFVTAGKPGFGLSLTIFSGTLNAILDYLFMGPLGMGIQGAAWGTAVGYTIPAVVGVLYFLRPRNTLHFARFKMNWRTLWQSCSNGASEMVTNLSSAVTTLLFNVIMIRYLGINGVAAITIVLYSQFLFVALFLGFSSGVAPIFSYNYGSGNSRMLKKILKISMGFVAIASLFVFACSLLFAPYIIQVFTPKDTAAYPIALYGFPLFAIGYLFSGANIFSSSFFTALSDGKTSATLSLFRTFIFIVLGLLLLPLVMEVTGVWLAIPFAEFLSFGLAVWYIIRYRKKYRYW